MSTLPVPAQGGTPTVLQPGDLIFSLGAFRFEHNRLTVAQPPTFEEWSATAQTTQLIEENGPWWVADMFLYGQDTYPADTWVQVAHSDFYHKQDGKTKMSVGRHFPSPQYPGQVYRPDDEGEVRLCRREDLSFTHHREVMGLPVEEQKELLDLAAKKHWSSGQLRREVAKRRDGDGDPKRETIARAEDAILERIVGNVLQVRVDWETAEKLMDYVNGEIVISISVSGVPQVITFPSPAASRRITGVEAEAAR